MTNRILKWGNSFGVRIPKVYMQKLNLKVGDLVELNEEGNKIIITKAEDNTLKSRIESFENVDSCEKFEWDSKGKEIW